MAGSVEKLFSSVFQQPKFVRKLLIVRSPQALKFAELAGFGVTTEEITALGSFFNATAGLRQLSR